MTTTVTLTAGLREMIASGRLTEDMIPDDFQWLHVALEEAERLTKVIDDGHDLISTLARLLGCEAKPIEIGFAPLLAERDALKARIADAEKERDKASALAYSSHYSPLFGGGAMPWREVAERRQLLIDDAAKKIAQLRAETDRLFSVAVHHQERAEAAESSLAASQRQIATLAATLRPFSAAVFNDNGDVTISTGHLRTDDWLKARTALAQLDAPQPDARDAEIERLKRENDEVRTANFRWLTISQNMSAEIAHLIRQNAALVEALKRIEKWEKFPATGRLHEDGTPMSYGWCYGSHGERDFMRGIASAAIASLGAPQEPFNADKVFAKIKALGLEEPTPDPLDAVIAEAVEVMRPFADIGANTPSSFADKDRNTAYWAVPIVGAFRDARAFVDKHGGGK